MDMIDFGNPNPNPSYQSFSAPLPSSDFILSDYLVLDDVVDHHQESWSQSTETESSEKAASIDVIQGFSDETSMNNSNMILKRCKREIKENNSNKVEEVKERVTFRTRSQVEIMDDGYKWRKYGKKSVKNSPYQRNYYKCSSEGCSVKKRVERDSKDSSYVLTSYDGVHNHESPSTSYYTTPPASTLLYSNEWILNHASTNSSSY